MFSPRARLLILASIAGAAFAGLFLWYRFAARNGQEPAYGVTFSTLYAKELGLDWRTAYLATLDELGVRRLRIPVYWNAVEKEKGTYDWSEVDWMLEEAAKREAEVILVIGRRVPRWPECHLPAWNASVTPEVLNRETLALLEAELLHFKEARSVKVWQIENEPFLPFFGWCPPPDREFLKQELRLARRLDTRPVMVTDAGETSTWFRTVTLGPDILGFSLYRLVGNEALGALYWPVSPGYYIDRLRAANRFVPKVILSELQAEPWFHGPVEEMPIEEQLRKMNPRRLKADVAFAASTEASEIYLWGVEWWFWLRQRGHEGMWEAARDVFR